MANFYPKKPVKSFLDLEVYQKSLECAVFVAKYIVRPSSVVDPDIVVIVPDADVAIPTTSSAKATVRKDGPATAAELIFHQMLPCALGLPHLIAEAHSVRFGSQKDCLILLERAMLHCNKMIVYLEETRDIANTGVSWEKFNELTKKYLYVRQKILNLQRSWKKYMIDK